MQVTQWLQRRVQTSCLSPPFTHHCGCYRSAAVVSNSLWPHRLQPTRKFHCPCEMSQARILNKAISFHIIMEFTTNITPLNFVYKVNTVTTNYMRIFKVKSNLYQKFSSSVVPAAFKVLKSHMWLVAHPTEQSLCRTCPLLQTALLNKTGVEGIIIPTFSKTFATTK